MLTHWIWLAHRPGLGDRMKLRLLQHFGSPENIFFADNGAFDHIEGISGEGKAALADQDLSPAEKILKDCRRAKLHILTIADAAYPVRLKNIDDPPILLYYKGTLPEFDALPMIGVVGTRKASLYGLQTAKRLGYQIGCCGGVVVSGMAAGIDSMAMSGALSAGQATVGVLGCGADVIYPSSNRSLFRDVEENGCILSEFPPGTPPAKWTFPKRNRIISGLSCGVLVAEAPEESGSLITARNAADQGRDVFAVPGNIDLPSFAGSNRLLREGAIVVSSGWDVVSEYQGIYPDKIRRADAPAHLTVTVEELRKQAENPLPKVAQNPALPGKKKALKKELEKKPIDKAASSSYSDVNTTFAGRTPEELQVLQCLQKGERPVDEIIAETGLTTGKMLAVMTMLELDGIIRRLPGKRISLK